MAQIRNPSLVRIDGRCMAYDEVSPSRPKGTILLLTGLNSKRMTWYRQLEELGREYRTIALDHRCMGDSDHVIGPYTIAHQADDAAAVMETLGVKKAHVIGISMGGFIAQQLALRHPSLIEKLVLTATMSGDWSIARPSAEVINLLRHRNPWDPASRAKIVYARIMASGYCESHQEDWDCIGEHARYKPTTEVAYYRQLQACLGFDVSRRLHLIKAPTLVIHGDSDPLVPVENGYHLARKIPDARLIIYPNTGHIPIVEKAFEFNRDVLSFLNEGEVLALAG